MSLMWNVFHCRLEKFYICWFCEIWFPDFNEFISHPRAIALVVFLQDALCPWSKIFTEILNHIKENLNTFTYIANIKFEKNIQFKMAAKSFFHIPKMLIYVN